MPNFPRREADVAALAGIMVHGLEEHAPDFPDSPVTIEAFQEAIARYANAKEASATAEGAAAEAFDEKQDALQNLSDKMKNVLRYAEITHRNDESKLKNIGWAAPANRRRQFRPVHLGRSRSRAKDAAGCTSIGRVLTKVAQFRPTGS